MPDTPCFPVLYCQTLGRYDYRTDDDLAEITAIVDAWAVDHPDQQVRVVESFAPGEERVLEVIDEEWGTLVWRAGVLRLVGLAEAGEVEAMEAVSATLGHHSWRSFDLPGEDRDDDDCCYS